LVIVCSILDIRLFKERVGVENSFKLLELLLIHTIYLGLVGILGLINYALRLHLGRRLCRSPNLRVMANVKSS
jgi:hypothetical protein